MHIHIHRCLKYPISYQASACSLSTWHFLKFPENSFEVLKFPENSFEVLKLLENSVEVLKILENKLESMKILENKLESLKLHENQPVDENLAGVFDGEYRATGGIGRNNSPEIETLTYHVLATYG
ncbi:hypothetical protein Tco_0705501 [Tanacetum coccineum]|uniref:Uncharacterized protein n=1 Tax=Tanacetum coccineum TaxID=301880 RepID=A0ABQ4Y4R9_9ASTR